MIKVDDCKFLEKTGLDLGAASTKIISTDQIVVEDRVRLKCMVCPFYGKNLKCPPYTPSIAEFRNILNDYSTAMVVKFKTPEISEETSKETSKYLLKKKNKVIIENQDIYNTLSSVWPDISANYKKMLNLLLELEKTAFNKGYTFSMAFFAGRCLLCENCNIDNGCQNSLVARFSAEAMGINLLKTAENAGIELKFHSSDNPSPITPMAILLID
jgi:predicted metal-binding protein